MTKISRQDALDYHSSGRAGKIEVIPSKSYSSQRDLSLAYSPGVAEPCKDISENPEDVYKYTAKGNLVAVISNGTAVLGLGDIGPEASKPVMEGKGLLFKIYADIDVFDIELNASEVDSFVHIVKAMEPTFGGINLEDIKAPECFEIEERLKKEMNIPVMHDDQHGTAIISGAALLNALEIAGKKIEEVKVVINGAGASAISCAKIYLSLGARKENIIMLDSKGVLYENRDKMDRFKQLFATKRPERTLEEAMKDADVFLGLSKGNIVTQDMLKSMADRPIVFALANPDPEITYELALEAREDVIMATGRSDNPNQVNNVLGFPYIFRGALDVRANVINEEMKIAAVYAIAELAKKSVPESVLLAYNKRDLHFGKEYIIPKPSDPRLITQVAPAVAKAAISSGVAASPITDWEKYKEELIKRLGLDNKLIKNITTKAKQKPKKVVFAEADNFKILKAAQIVLDEGIAEPILLGDRDSINKICADHKLELPNVQLIDPREKSNQEFRKEFGYEFFQKRKRKGLTLFEAEKLMRDRNHFGAMMVKNGSADALISGLTRNYANTIRPALQIIGKQKNINKVAGMYIMMAKNGPLFFADATVNITPTAEDLRDIVKLTVQAVKQFNITPRIALLSYSNFGSSAKDEESLRIRRALDLIEKDNPDLVVDGEMQANIALNTKLRDEIFSFNKLKGKRANTFIFPNLSAGNIAYKLLQELEAAEAIGPILLGMDKPVHILQMGSSVREIVNMVTIAVVDAQARE
ncbi:MAG: NADP-dependent malic enzyme [Chitinophagaceae bacterium]|nr:MAG: NADP-dependent malic enzyme [Chitinophagaceae bacterium]